MESSPLYDIVHGVTNSNNVMARQIALARDGATRRRPQALAADVVRNC
jgi:hypothetical protein